MKETARFPTKNVLALVWAGFLLPLIESESTGDPMTREFAKSMDSLTEIFDFLTAYVRRENIAEEFLPSLHLVVEEVFVNLVRYNTDSRHDVAIELSHTGDELTVILRDRDVQRYDITEHPDVDINQPVENRQPGGLGVHFVRAIMDDIRYDYTDRTSTITLIKRFEEEDAGDTVGQ